MNHRRRITALALASLLGAEGCDPSDDAASEPDPPSNAKADGFGDELSNRCAPVIVGFVESDRAIELSGLVASRTTRGVLWSHNDGGGKEREFLLAIGPRGEDLGAFKLKGIELTDWEDLAIGPGGTGDHEVLYVADIGDNDIERKSVQVLRVPEPTPSPGANAEVRAEAIDLTYEDGPHDAEAMFVSPEDGTIYVITKTSSPSVDPTTRLFGVPASDYDDGRGELVELLDQHDAPGLAGVVVGADISADGRRIAVYFKDKGARVFEVAPTQSVEAALQGSSVAEVLVDERIALDPQWRHIEAVAFTPESDALLFVNEGERPPLMRTTADCWAR